MTLHVETPEGRCICPRCSPAARAAQNAELDAMMMEINRRCDERRAFMEAPTRWRRLLSWLSGWHGRMQAIGVTWGELADASLASGCLIVAILAVERIGRALWLAAWLCLDFGLAWFK